MTVDLRAANLRMLLDALVPSDAAEAAHRTRMLELLASAERGHDPFAREHYDPGHFTASAFVVSRERDALLLIFHGKLRRWLQPGGHVDASDRDIVATAHREVAEEVQLFDLPLAHPGIFDVDVHEIPARGDTPAHHHFDVRFLFEAARGEGRAASDALGQRWVLLTEVAKLESDESVLRAVRKLAGRAGAEARS